MFCRVETIYSGRANGKTCFGARATFNEVMQLCTFAPSIIQLSHLDYIYRTRRYHIRFTERQYDM